MILPQQAIPVVRQPRCGGAVTLAGGLMPSAKSFKCKNNFLVYKVDADDDTYYTPCTGKQGTRGEDEPTVVQ